MRMLVSFLLPLIEVLKHRGRIKAMQNFRSHNFFAYQFGTSGKEALEIRYVFLRPLLDGIDDGQLK